MEPRNPLYPSTLVITDPSEMLAIGSGIEQLLSADPPVKDYGDIMSWSRNVDHVTFNGWSTNLDTGETVRLANPHPYFEVIESRFHLARRACEAVVENAGWFRGWREKKTAKSMLTDINKAAARLAISRLEAGENIFD